MLTFSEAFKRTPETPDEIAAYLSEAFQGMQDRTPFRTGEVVRIATRSGLSPDIAIGDVGVLLCDLPDQLFSWVLVFTSGGQPIVIQVQTAHIAKRNTAQGE